MPTKEEFNDFLKEQGRWNPKWDKPTPKAPTDAAPAPSAGEGAPAPTPTPASAPTTTPTTSLLPTTTAEEEDIADTPWGQRQDLARGMVRGGAKLGTDVVRLGDFLAKGFSPSLSGLVHHFAPQAARDAFHAMENKGQEESANLTEGAGELIGENAPLAALAPVGGLVDSLVTRGLIKALPRTAARTIAGNPVYMGAGQWAPGASRTLPGIIPRWAARTAMGTGKAAGAATEGAIGGAIANPEHPGAGLAEGAVGATVPAGFGELVKSKGGRQIGAHAIASLATWGALHMLNSGLGIPTEVALSLAIPLRWKSTEAGGWVHRKGDYLVNQAGKIVAEFPSAIAGAAASKGMQTLFPQEEGGSD